ncbi:MAG: helix-turn-helix domain-containing protein [Mogibacterium sp.]|nr:helix-turn-helix domain-containing protein [Mogibacterium sp.]
MKFKVTPELATLIRTIRMQNGISSKDLAEAIGRSPSYVTKLEKGAVRTIRKDELTEILSYITEGEDFYEDKFPAIIRTLSTILTPENMILQTWLLQYDSYERPIRLPEALTEVLRDKMARVGIEAEELAEIINANEDVRDGQKLPVNEVVIMDYPQGQVLRIRASVTPEEIRRLCTEKEPVTNYGTLYSILFILVKLEKYGRIGFMEPPQAREVLQETGRILAYHEVYSLTKYGQVLASGEFQSSQMLVLNTFETANSNTINGILEIFRKMGEIDRMQAMETSDQFLANLEWDPAFMMKIVGMRFDRIGNMSYSNRKKLLAEIAGLVEKYEHLPAMEKRMEKY